MKYRAEITGKGYASFLQAVEDERVHSQDIVSVCGVQYRFKNGKFAAIHPELEKHGPIQLVHKAIGNYEWRVVIE